MEQRVKEKRACIDILSCGGYRIWKKPGVAMCFSYQNKWSLFIPYIVVSSLMIFSFLFSYLLLVLSAFLCYYSVLKERPMADWNPPLQNAAFLCFSLWLKKRAMADWNPPLQNTAFLCFSLWLKKKETSAVSLIPYKAYPKSILSFSSFPLCKRNPHVLRRYYV